MTSPQADPRFRSIRVLVIDDDEICRQAMVELLNQAGHYATELPSPIGTTQHILNERVDVVVLDVVMPSLRGDKLAQLLRKQPRLRHLGVVLVTGATAEELGPMVVEVSASAVVEKSALDRKLVHAVERAYYDSAPLHPR